MYKLGKYKVYLYGSEYLVSEYRDVMCTHILVGLYPHFVVWYRERAHQLYLPDVLFIYIRRVSMYYDIGWVVYLCL